MSSSRIPCSDPVKSIALTSAVHTLMCDVLLSSLHRYLYPCIANTSSMGKSGWWLAKEHSPFPVRSCYQCISSTYAWCASYVTGFTSSLLQDMTNHSPTYPGYLVTAYCLVVSRMSICSVIFKHMLVLKVVHGRHKLCSHVCCLSANTLYVPAVTHQHVHTIATIKGSGYT